MDIVLELIDTFIADHVYAHFFPIKSDSNGFANKMVNNTSVHQVVSQWKWQPATKFFQIEPPPAAYMSSLNRDNPYRQLATLYFITW